MLGVLAGVLVGGERVDVDSCWLVGKGSAGCDILFLGVEEALEKVGADAGVGGGIKLLIVANDTVGDLFVCGPGFGTYGCFWHRVFARIDGKR